MYAQGGNWRLLNRSQALVTTILKYLPVSVYGLFVFMKYCYIYYILFLSFGVIPWHRLGQPFGDALTALYSFIIFISISKDFPY